ncbi:MAG: AmmeMemoRadiSam system protein B [Bdellovibrionota bacterium]
MATLLPHYRCHPELREPLTVRIDNIEGETVLVLECPLGISPRPLCLNPIILPILRLCTGEYSVSTIQEKLASHGCTIELIHQLTTLLDDHLFLKSPRFEHAQQEVKNAFLREPIRQPALAGLTYPKDSYQLETEVRTYLEIETLSQDISPLSSLPLRCLVTPHIDYRRGGSCYGKAFRTLLTVQPEIIFLLGTSHQWSESLFLLTKKHFQTPLGVVNTDHRIVDAIAHHYGQRRSFQDEFLHKREHSLELQLPFIQYLAPNARIVPILVGSFHKMITSGRYPHEFEDYTTFVDSLAHVIEAEELTFNNRCLFIAGVDMAHIGSHFGDERELSDEWMNEVHGKDVEYLTAVRELDSYRIFDHIAVDHDARRICGFPTMITLADLFTRLQLPLQAHEVDYQQAVNQEHGCAVTFGSIAYYSSSLITS